MGYVLAGMIGYLLGSVPVALLVARRHGVDLRRTGDGNPGAWNALEQLGGRRAWPAFVGDGLKAAIAAGIGWLLGGFWAAWAGVLGAMVGHALPVFARFRGGMAVMAFVGGGIVLSPVAGVAALAVCALVTAVASFKWGARVGVFGFPVLQLATDAVERVAAVGVLMTVVGLLFGLRRRTSGRATSAADGPPTR